MGVILFAIPASGAHFEFKGKIDAQDPTSRLLAYYVKEFSPETLDLCIDEQPDETGRFRDIYMNLTGVLIEGIRLDKLIFRMYDAQFNAPTKWASGEVECESVLQIYAQCLLKEKDINRKLATETFGKDDHWQDISMKIAPSGLYAKGTYIAKVLFVTLRILLEVESGLKIVENKELWLEGYKVRVNTMSVPDYITKQAISQIQPLLSLRRFPLPLKLHKIEFQEGQALLATRNLPQPPEDGITYHYAAE
ncbi:MAG: LmeA family phospholipid-binding protein [Synergistaceae bacterium]|nr:LmeA family phospholipid-binding protein [Synergistaceae bacterium]